jgi:hypothetical protein
MNVSNVAAATAFDRWAQVPASQQAAPRIPSEQDTANGIAPTPDASAASTRPPAPEGTGKHVDKVA